MKTGITNFIEEYAIDCCNIATENLISENKMHEKDTIETLFKLISYNNPENLKKRLNQETESGESMIVLHSSNKILGFACYGTLIWDHRPRNIITSLHTEKGNKYFYEKTLLKKIFLDMQRRHKRVMYLPGKNTTELYQELGFVQTKPEILPYLESSCRVPMHKINIRHGDYN